MTFLRTRAGVSTSVGAAYAGYIPLLNASGVLDRSFFESNVWGSRIYFGGTYASPHAYWRSFGGLSFGLVDEATGIPILDINVGGTLTVNGLFVGTNLTLPSNVVTRANLSNGAGLSVIGRAANTTGAVADIVASAARQFMATNSGGTSVVWRTIDLADLPNGAAKSVLGVAGNSAAARADITGTAARQGLFVNSGNTGIGFRLMEAADLPGGNWMNATKGTLANTTTNLTGTGDAWETIGGGTLVLPAAGTYEILAQISAQVAASVVGSAATIHGRIYNVTDAAVVGSAVNVASVEVTGVFAAGTAHMHFFLAVAASKTLRVEGMRRTSAGATYSHSSIDGTSVANGGTRLSYKRLN